MASSLNTTPTNNVFINCPFDHAYKPLFDAIVFTVMEAGFRPRCALESRDSGQTRLDKIVQIIRECRFGIHDLSRTEYGTTGLPRFNMPFECGLYWGCMHYGGKHHANKCILVLDTEQYRYQQSLSDIAGQDIAAHGNQPTTAIHRVRSWLRSSSHRTNIPGGNAIAERYQRFQADLPNLIRRVGITMQEIRSAEYYGDYLEMIRAWIIESDTTRAQPLPQPV